MRIIFRQFCQKLILRIRLMAGNSGVGSRERNENEELLYIFFSVLRFICFYTIVESHIRRLKKCKPFFARSIDTIEVNQSRACHPS